MLFCGCSGFCSVHQASFKLISTCLCRLNAGIKGLAPRKVFLTCVSVASECLVFFRNCYLLHAAYLLHVDQGSEDWFHLLGCQVCPCLFLHGNYIQVFSVSLSFFGAGD